MVGGIYGGVKTPRGLKSALHHVTSFVGSACDPSRGRALSCAHSCDRCFHPMAPAFWLVRPSSCRPACFVCFAEVGPARLRRESSRRGQLEKRTVHTVAFGSPLLIG